MKKILLVLLLSPGLFLSNTLTEAAEYKEPTKVAQRPTEDFFFPGLKDTDKVVRLENGTFIYGEATVGEFGLRKNLLTIVNSETDPNSITVETAKKILETEKPEDSNKISPRGITSSFNYVGLRHGGHAEGHFSRSAGWNSLNTVYQSTANGPYLRYYSGYDSAMVGTAQQAVRTFSGGYAGNFLSADSYQYFSGINTMYTYYGSSNVQWQAYQIINI